MPANTSSIRRLCVQWPRFGPYHLARLEATHRHLHERGVELIGLETTGRDGTYAWRPEQGDTPFQRAQVFPFESLDALAPALIHDGITKMLDRLQPDAVAINSYSLPDARACLAWCRRHRRVAVVMTDSKEDDAPRVAWRERIKAHLVRQFDAALLAGTPHRAYFKALGFPADAVFLGYDVVDNTFFRKGAAAARARPDTWRHLPGLDIDTPFFLASNRFIARKNLESLLRAYAAYRRSIDAPWRLVLLGDGPERDRLEALMEAKQIGGVTLAGFRQIDELPAYYGLASAFVHPARIDQWGLVVNEALAAGLPVLVSDRAGCAQDLVKDGRNGYRFDPDDPNELATRMRQMASPEVDRGAMGRCSQAIIAAWSPERFAEHLWQAVRHGRTRAHRPYPWSARALLWLLRHTARSATSFHTVEA